MKNISKLNDMMNEIFNDFKQALGQIHVSNDILNEFCLAVLHFNFSINTKETFPLVKNNRVFDWKQFEKENSLYYAKANLENL